MSSLEKCLFSSLAHFLIESFIFLELSFRSCLYIFEINPLSVASFAIIFSQSEGCLFTLLIVSFVGQKLLSFIRCHLFIFVFVSNILGVGQKIWNASRICVSSLLRGYANLLCIVPILVYVLPKWARFQISKNKGIVFFLLWRRKEMNAYSLQFLSLRGGVY